MIIEAEGKLSAPCCVLWLFCGKKVTWPRRVPSERTNLCNTHYTLRSVSCERIVRIFLLRSYMSSCTCKLEAGAHL